MRTVVSLLVARHRLRLPTRRTTLRVVHSARSFDNQVEEDSSPRLTLLSRPYRLRRNSSRRLEISTESPFRGKNPVTGARQFPRTRFYRGTTSGAETFLAAVNAPTLKYLDATAV